MIMNAPGFTSISGNNSVCIGTATQSKETGFQRIGSFGSNCDIRESGESKFDPSTAKTSNSSPVNFWDLNQSAINFAKIESHNNGGEQKPVFDMFLNTIHNNFINKIEDLFKADPFQKSQNDEIGSINAALVRARSRKVKLKVLSKLSLVLIKLFLNEELFEDDFNLKALDLHILAEILIRKNRSLSQSR